MNSGPTTQTPLSFSTNHGLTQFPQMEVDFDWDLNHLLLAQMNFTGASQFSDIPPVRAQAYPNSPTSTAGNTATVGNPTSSYNMPGDFPPPSMPLMSPFTTFSPPAAFTQDMAAMWSDAPNNFK